MSAGGLGALDVLPPRAVLETLLRLGRIPHGSHTLEVSSRGEAVAALGGDLGRLLLVANWRRRLFACLGVSAPTSAFLLACSRLGLGALALLAFDTLHGRADTDADIGNA